MALISVSDQPDDVYLYTSFEPFNLGFRRLWPSMLTADFERRSVADLIFDRP
jgi:hypothetical protein